MVTQKCQSSNPVIMVFMQIWIIMATIFEEIAAEHEALLMIDIQQSDGTLDTFSDCAITTKGNHVTEVYIYVKVPKADSDMNKLQELKPKACYCTFYCPHPRIGDIRAKPTAIEVSNIHNDGDILDSYTLTKKTWEENSLHAPMFSIQGMSPTNVKFIGRNDSIIYTAPVDFIHGHYDSIVHIQPDKSLKWYLHCSTDGFKIPQPTSFSQPNSQHRFSSVQSYLLIVLGLILCLIMYCCLQKRKRLKFNVR